MKHIQICHSSEENEEKNQDVSVVFRLNKHAMMIFDYKLSYESIEKEESRKALLTGKKYLLSKTEISERWKVLTMFTSNRSTKACGIRISHFYTTEEKFVEEG